MRKFAILMAASLLAISTARAAPLQQEITELYRRGLGGDKDAVEQCIAKLEAVVAQQPDNQLARVYLGSAYTLRSRDLGFGPKKLSTLRQGLAVMDAAVAAAPDNPKVRLARALTTSALPGFFGRKQSSRDDFARLLESAQQQPQKFEEGELQVIYSRAGLIAKAAGDRARAQTLLLEAKRHPADPALQQKIEEALK